MQKTHPQKLSPTSKSISKPTAKPTIESAIGPSALNLSAKSFWPKTTELVSLRFSVNPLQDGALYPQYTIGLHAWFLDQIRQFDPELSAYMHDGESEKPFCLSGLSGHFSVQSRDIQLHKAKTYDWRVSALSKPMSNGLAHWLRVLPTEIALKNAPLSIQAVFLDHPPTTYAKLLQQGKAKVADGSSSAVSLSFTSPTSFRHKGHHLPLPWPVNVFHSYLRRWNLFATKPVDQNDFLDWIDQYVVIQRHRIESLKVVAGKRGAVTGFVGSITYNLDAKASQMPEFQALFYALIQLAPYCGTGHKTTFGLGETCSEWQGRLMPPDMPSMQKLLAERITELTTLFVSQRKRQGGSRAQEIAETWATIVARREQGDALKLIAEDLDLTYETVKTYSKLAKRALND
jgi:CRISPR-associated endoribonuclease Cas6